MDSSFKEFLFSSYEDLKHMEDCIVSIEEILNSEGLPDPELVNVLFRHMYGIKHSAD
ncbi:MAG TPA: hypothetical protein PL048_17495 [Leptospiraceae bacterium]|nr:hypothetical protein [Leptospiraceae bacterium]HMY69468.1 hypothetical protein [Leptospiraceae bacterium]HMZ60573.1 hypothetical protein [Leptospiraceae bacterium]HNF12172.1 hypothetical protein [Leptospiraceae bacterium]HNF23365.1 hypothetical protein [Leptospiraceae bacterium]